MKRAIILSIISVTAVLSGVSCKEDALRPESVIEVSETIPTEFDAWLDVNFVKPYNIDFKYRFELNESDMNYWTIPADYESSIKMAHLVKYLCIDTYDEVAGIDFTRSYFPKMFFLIGEFEYRNNGTIILGTAEGGKKILLSGINDLPLVLNMGDPDYLNEYYIKTIHHEFTHILNQTKNFPVDFSLVNGEGYVADSWSEEPYVSEYLHNGFISNYAQHSSEEDFAETFSIYVTNPQEFWDACIKEAGEEPGKKINAKLNLVKAYMAESWDIDLDELRSTVQRRQKDVFDGKIDLDDISID